MDQNIQKALWIGVSVLFFVAVISLGVLLFSQGVDLVEGAEKSTSRMVTKLRDAEFDAYNGTEVSGSRVVSAIKDFSDQSGEVIIVVKTKKNETSYISSASLTSAGGTVSTLTSRTKTAISKEIKDAKDPIKATYINPSGKFDANVCYDENEVARAIIFIQK